MRREQRHRLHSSVQRLQTVGKCGGDRKLASTQAAAEIPNPRVMWTEVDHLKRQGQNVRAIEYYLSDLEASRRLGEQGAAANRYAANDLEYEIQRLNRQRQR